MGNFFHNNRHLFTFVTAIILWSGVASFAPKQKKFDLYDLKGISLDWSLDTKKVTFDYNVEVFMKPNFLNKIFGRIYPGCANKRIQIV